MMLPPPTLPQLVNLLHIYHQLQCQNTVAVADSLLSPRLQVYKLLGFKFPSYPTPTLLLSCGLSVRVLWHLIMTRPHIIHASSPGAAASDGESCQVAAAGSRTAAAGQSTACEGSLPVTWSCCLCVGAHCNWRPPNTCAPCKRRAGFRIHHLRQAACHPIGGVEPTMTQYIGPH